MQDNKSEINLDTEAIHLFYLFQLFFNDISYQLWYGLYMGYLWDMYELSMRLQIIWYEYGTSMERIRS